MARYAERKRGTVGRTETLRRREVRATKYASFELPSDLLHI